MRIEISGKHIETGEALQKHVTEAITNSVQKYFKTAINARVIFSKHGNFFGCEVIVDEGVHGQQPVVAKDQADDIYTAFNLALAHAAKQLRRTKRKMRSRTDKISLSEASARAANG